MVKNSKKRYIELKRQFGNKFIFNHISIKDLFENILIKHLQKEMKEYSSAFIWCWACKISMHTQSIVYNKLNSINKICDGSSYDSREMVEQSIFSISLIKDLYKMYKIDFEPISYKIKREKKVKELKELGLNLGISFMGRNIGIQPKCIPGELYYSPYMLLKKEPFHQAKEVNNFYKKKLPLIKKYIQEKIGKNGLL